MNPAQRKTTLIAIILIAAFVGSLVGRNPNPPQQPPGDDAFSGTVISVADGDTMTLRVDGRKVKVRLQGIDCPEREQPFGNKAGDFVRSLVEGEIVRVKKLGVDQYDRVLGEAFVGDRNVNKELLREGLAWWYERHARDRQDYRDLQREAREEGRGVWSDPDPIAPWEYRQRQWNQSN